MTDPTAVPVLRPQRPLSPPRAPSAWLPSSSERPSSGLPSATSLVDRVRAALRVEGLDPLVDEDGDVDVTMEGQRLFVRCVDSRPALVRVFGQWQLDEGADELTQLRAANAVTGALNLVKVTIQECWVVVAVDVVVADGLDLRALLPAAFDAVLGSVRTWQDTVDELLGLGGSTAVEGEEAW